jgi:hypothetical protein
MWFKLKCIQWCVSELQLPRRTMTESAFQTVSLLAVKFFSRGWEIFKKASHIWFSYCLNFSKTWTISGQGPLCKVSACFAMRIGLDIIVRVQLAHSHWRLTWLSWNICVLLTPIYTSGCRAKLIHHQGQALGSHLLLLLSHYQRVSSSRETPGMACPKGFSSEALFRPPHSPFGTESCEGTNTAESLKAQQMEHAERWLYRGITATWNLETFLP